MPSQATDVTGYLAEVPLSWRPTLDALRDLHRRSLVGYDESIAYGMPTYSRNGKPEVAFASRKNYVSIHILKTEIVEAHREELAAASVGKGCIRYSKAETIDFRMIEKLLIETRDSAEAAC
jgi:uncharacterized protein YdhG (YjbR/CyaY superfamily)